MNYINLRDTVVAPLIRKNGKAIKLRRPGSSVGWTKIWDAAQGRYKWTYGGTPPPDGGTVVYVDPIGTPIDLPGYAIEKDYKQSEIDGTTVMANDRRFLVVDIPEPNTADKLIVGSSVLTIVNVMAIQPGDTTLVRILQCRGV